MRKDKTKKVNKILTISMSIVLFVAVIITIVAISYNPSFDDVAFNKTTSSYSSNQAQIVDPKTTTTTDTITMTDAYADVNSIGSKIVTISTDEELYKFSLACDTNTAYLSKSYKLSSNIKYSIMNRFIPVGYNGTSFSGTFDGNGYEISNLFMENITPQNNNESKYSNMYYYAMFSTNKGTIKNLGLVESQNIIISSELEHVILDGGIANLVGHNETGGTVEYCYYKDLRDMIEYETGITVFSNYRMAGLVYLNDGTFNNCYVAASTIANHTIVGYENINSVCYQDNKYATSSNIYYYDGSISSYRTLAGGVREITYKDNVFDDYTVLTPDKNPGTYCSSVDSLNTNYATNNRWYLPTKYDNDIAIYIKNDTPILRGLSFTTNGAELFKNRIYTFTISDTKDFLYMFELMNSSDYFAGDKVIYKITNDINLLNILPSTYAYSKIITSTITSNNVGGTVKPKLSTNVTSNAPTIYNFDPVAADRRALTLGIDCYGLFPYLGGTVSNLNIIPSAVNLDTIEATTNVKGIAAVSGYVEKGHISNVNVYITTTHSSRDIKEFYLGGVVGILGGEGTVDNCTAAGSFTMSRFVSTAPVASVYTQGNAIGGVVGYISETYGNIDTCLSGVDMTLNFDGSACNYQIGGVVGAAYSMTEQNLENIGTISIGASGSNVNYNSLYVSGVVGRQFGVQKQILNLTNQGAITLYAGNSSADTYLSGVLNADIVTTPRSAGVIVSTDKTKDGKYRFRASSLTNRANIVTAATDVAANIEYTSGVNILAKNGFVSELSGLYNLNYTEKYNSSATLKKATLGAQSFDLSLVYKYSGVVNVVSGDNPNPAMTTNISTAYNLRAFNITAAAAIGGSRSYEYYGTARGKYINYEDVRNEGKITSTFTKTVGDVNTDTSKICLIGVFEEVSPGCSADKIFNGGDISLTFNGCNINGSVIASGICLRNSGYNASTIDTFNPSSNDFDSKAKGAINDAINNGVITVDNPTNFASVKIAYADIWSPNGQSKLGSEVSTTYDNGSFIAGDVFASGIATYNEAPITNTFNLSNIFAANYIKSTENEKEINVAGLVGINIGKYAYILNSANNGTLKGINLSSNDTYLSNVNVSGIIARNDELENGSNYSSNTTNPNSNQIVSFTINYGDIYSYNFRANIQTTAYEPSAKSAGIVAMGLLNTINVMNYGNIYGSETASGIFGVMYFARFAGEVDANNKVYIANTINYGNVYMLTKGYNRCHGNKYLDYNALGYSTFKNLKTSTIVKTNSTAGNIQAFTEVVRNSNYLSIIGSVFSLANYATSDAASNIAIRYLISFNSECSIVGATVAAPSNVNVAVDTLYSAHLSTNAATGAYLNDDWLGSFVQYAPLTTDSFSGKFVTNISANGVVTTGNRTYNGIFNSNFAFQQAILGKVTFNLTNNPTDAYLTDYFQFVGFQYINPTIFEKIGWQTLAYSTAANNFAMNVENVVKVLNKSSNYISTVSASARDVFSWMSDSVASDLDTLIDSLIANEQQSDLLKVLEYIYSDDSQSNIYITTTVRQNVLSKLIGTNNDVLLSYLNGVLQYDSGYSATLAKSIVIEEDEVKAYIDRYIDDLYDVNPSAVLSLYDGYISYLETNANSYFNYGSNEAKRIATLTTLFSEINDLSFYRELVSILDIQDSSLSSSAKMLAGYQTLNVANKKTLFETIITYNFGQDRLDEYIGAMASNIDYYSELVANGFNISSLDELYERAQLMSGSTAATTSVVNERVNLWNLIRNTSIFRNNFNTYATDATTYFKATEYNNTYQSVTEPHNGGAYTGDTSENRLSYLYTKDITPQVYFYGPYTAAPTITTSEFDFSKLTTLNSQESGRRVNDPIVNWRYLNRYDNNNYKEKYYSIFHYTDNSLWTSDEIMKSRGGSNSTITYRSALAVTDPGYMTEQETYFFPMLLYYDFNNEQLGGANRLYTLSTDYYQSGTYTTDTYQFRGFSTASNTGQLNFTGSLDDPMIEGVAKISCTDWCGTLYGPNDLYLRVSNTGETFSLNNATAGPIFDAGENTSITLANGTTKNTLRNRFYIQDSNGANHLVQGGATDTIEIGRMVNGTFNAIHVLKNFSGYYRDIYSFIASEVGLRMYTSCVSNNATTGLHSTGRTGIYRHAGGWYNYFTWKQKNNTRTFTSQYIDYSRNDLLNLDGVLTEYDGETYSNDEREIINTLFNTYFLKSNKYEGFRKLVQAALLEALGDSTIISGTSTRGAEYIDNFFMNNIYQGTVSSLNNSIPFAYLYESNGTTVQAHLNGLQSFTGDNKNLLIYGAAGNQTKYIGLLKRLKAIRAIESNASYSQYIRILDYLRTHPGYITNDVVGLNNFSSMSMTDLDYYLSCFDGTGDVPITTLYDMAGKMSAYTGSVTKNTSTYNTVTYDYGLKFSSMTLTPASTDTRIVIIAKSTGGTVSLTDQTHSVSKDVSTIGEYYFETGGATAITLTSNSDVIVYSINFVQDPTHNAVINGGNVTVNTEANTNAKYITAITRDAAVNAINNALTTNLGATYYKVTNYSVTYNISVYNSNNRAQTMYFSTSSDQATLTASELATAYEYPRNSTTARDLVLDDVFFGANIFAVWHTNNKYQYQTARYITAATYSISYNYISGGSAGTASKNVTSSITSLYDASGDTVLSYTSNNISVNANSVTLPSEDDLMTGLASMNGVQQSSIIITGFSGTFVLRNTWNYTVGLRIYNSSNSTVLGETNNNVASGQTGVVNVNDLSDYLGQLVNGRYYYSNYYNGNATIVSYTYTVTYRIDDNIQTITLPTLANAQSLVLSDSGYSSWNSNLTINSVTASITVRNRYNNAYTLYIYNDSTNAVISTLNNVPAGGTATASINLAQYYGNTISVRFSQNGNYYVESNKVFVMDSHYYTVNYSYPNYTVSPSTIYKNRLLNLNISYSDAQNKYLSSIYNSSTNVATLYNDFVKENVVNFTPVNTSGNDSNPTNLFVNQLTDAKKVEFARKIVENSNMALYYLISQLANTNAKLGDVLKAMDKASNGYAFVADGIVYLDDSSRNLITTKADVLKTLVATYIAADYRNVYNNGGNVYNTVYRNLVANVNTNATGTSETYSMAYNGNMAYIESTGTFDSAKYNLFVEYILGESVSTSGYGIFALSSSRGIQNGAFIPDNVNLASMDAKYNTNKKISNVSYIELTTENNTAWRDKVGGTNSETNTITNTSSVNYHVIVEMKQLVKAISNVIFELDLTCNDTTLYSSTDQIDYENKVITYYVSEAYLNYIASASSLPIAKLVYADTATSNKDGANPTITLTKTYGYDAVAIDSSSFVANKYYVESAGTYTKAETYTEGTMYYELTQIDVADAITIYPPERAYTANYKISFKKIDNTITTFSYVSMRYLTSETATTYQDSTGTLIPYYGAKVTFNVTANLPNGMDLKSFFNITNETKDLVWEFDPDTSNNGIISNNQATIVINVDISMKKGQKAFVLNLYGSSKSITNISKNENRNSLITSFGYDGTDYTSDMQGSSHAASSDILFGRAFDYDDLTKPYILTTDTALVDNKTYYTQNGTNNSYSYSRVVSPDVADIATYYEPNPEFYLYSFEISSNATVAISATKAEDETTKLMTYTVTYVVKSEYGSTTTYTHTLTENSYFANNSAFAALYKEGVAVSSDGIYKTNFYYGEELINAYDLSSLTYSSSAADNFVAVIFNRGYEPQYRIRYDLSHFYGDTTHYSVAAGSQNPSTVTPQNTYAGITVTVDDDQEPGTYMFNYIYTNTGNWTSEGSYVKLSSDAEFDPNETYYEIDDDDNYVIRVVTERNFSRYKARLYIYQSGGDPTYTRTYTFPALYIVKDFAIDALFHKLSFLDESKVLGGTASVMLPTTPISAGSANTDEDAKIYDTIFANYQDQKIIIRPNEITYDETATDITVTDYYTVGTVSDTDLENYAPSIKVEDHAQVFKYTTLTKLTKYGSENHQEKANGGEPLSDSDVLKDKNNMFIYVPFVHSETVDGKVVNTYETFMIKLDANMKWVSAYEKDYDGKTETKLIKTFTTPFTTKAGEDDPTLTVLTYKSKNYKIAEFAGKTDVTSEDSKNISLFMDYVGTPLEDHFWYVSYVVFSEYFLAKGKTDAKNNKTGASGADGIDDLGAVRYYHISIVDASNTVYFDVSLYAPENFKLDDIYLTFAEDVYDRDNNFLRDVQLSCYLEKAKDEQENLIYGPNNSDVEGLVLYQLKLSMAAMPAGYIYFYVDLPNGYGAICYTTRGNEINENTAPGSDNKGAYLPKTSIIPITIGLKIIVSELTGESSSVWAVNTSDLYTRNITYMGTYTATEE